MGPDDTAQLQRFIVAQQDTFAAALSELRRGRKTTHWMWFIFPQLDGLGHSATARRYAILGPKEAEAYLRHPTLGARLLDCCRAILAVPEKTATGIFGSPDDLKLRSCATLFSLVPGAPGEFQEVLDRFFGGHPDPRTLELLEKNGGGEGS